MMRYSLNFFGQENRGTIVTKAFEITAKLWKYVTKIISTENTIITDQSSTGPGARTRWLKDQFNCNLVLI